LLSLCLYAQTQLLLSDYVQHYGLRRAEVNGRAEPVGPQHSWNAPNPFSSALMLNAPRHSDHHARPARPYPGLELNRETMPILPYSLPMMAVIALVPPLWRRVMDKRARSWANTRP
jgi:alkane 1-monooxygenase